MDRTASGDWGDGNWIDEFLVPVAEPTADQVAMINSLTVAVPSNTTAEANTVVVRGENGNLILESDASLTADWLSLEQGGGVDVHGNLDLTLGIWLADGTFNLHSDTTIRGYFEVVEGTVNLNDRNLTIEGYLGLGNYNHYEDPTSSSPIIFNRTSGTLTILDKLELFTGTQMTLEAGDSVGGSILISGDSVLTINGEISPTGLYVSYGKVIQNANLTADHLSIGAWSFRPEDHVTYERLNGTLSLDFLDVSLGAEMLLMNGDSVVNIYLSHNAVLTFKQLEGYVDGLDLEYLDIRDDAILHILFDKPDLLQDNWGLRLLGDRLVDLENWLAQGMITSNSSLAYAYRAGGYTYFGYSAIPEPSSLILVGTALAGAGLSLRRKFMASRSGR